MKLSIAIISFNEEENIVNTLKAAKDIADEIIVVDSFSTDSTAEKAKQFGAKVYLEEWKGHIAQKNSALEKCSGEWILAIDCDEVISDKLISSIKEAILSDKYDGYRLNRRTFYMGKLLKYSWQPDLKLRLVRNISNAKWLGYDPHDVLYVDGDIGYLEGDLVHYSYRDLSDHMYRTVKYAKIAAESYYKKGKRSSLFKILVRPVTTFLNKLIIKRSILDGTRGILAAFSSSYYTYMKYSFLWEMGNKKDNE